MSTSALTRRPSRLATRACVAALLACAGLALLAAAPADRAAGLPAPAPAGAADNPKPIPLDDGLHLLIDAFLIADSQNVTRRVNSPQRDRAEPVVTSAEGFRTIGGGTVEFDSLAGRFRMWYGAGNDDQAADFTGPFQAYLESPDGIHWEPPFQRIDSIDVTFGHAILDEGPDFPAPAERFKQVYLRLPKPFLGSFQIHAAYSADGIHWEDYSERSIFPTQRDWGDIPSPFYNDACACYTLIHRVLEPYTWTNAEGRVLTEAIRLVGLSVSPDFKTWTEPTLIVTPDSRDPGVTQFYSIGGIERRGDLFLGMLRVLRDDVIVEGAPPTAYGYGYTVLAWSRDGRRWERDYAADAFFAPDPRLGVWDHAHAWIFSAVDVADETYFYYDGFRWGHKHEVEADRQIGLVRMPRDRYVAWESGASGGTLRTQPLMFAADSLWLNADAAGGEISVQVLDVNGNPLPGFTYADCGRISGDQLEAPVRCSRPLGELKHLPVRLEFSLVNASLFAFTLE